MAMHVVLGDGEMTRKELTESLSDLWKADEAAGQPFWFLLQGKSNPTDTDKALVAWLEKNELYYEVITDDQEAMDPVYSQPQQVYVVKRLAPKIVNLLQTKPEEDETAELLALFVDLDDATAAADRWLNNVIQAVYDAQFPIRALNDGLIEIDLAAGMEKEDEEEVTAPLRPSPVKAVAKKAVAKPAEPSGKLFYSREELEEMDLDGLKKVAESMGISLAPRTRMATYIDHILGEAKETPVAEVTEVEPVSVSSNGHVDIDALADAVAAILAKRLQNA